MQRGPPSHTGGSAGFHWSPLSEGQVGIFFASSGVGVFPYPALFVPIDCGFGWGGALVGWSLYVGGILLCY